MASIGRAALGAALVAAACSSKADGRVKGVGDFCAAAGECQSDHCVDGVCCDTACDGLCESCSQTLSRGQCAPARAGTDPRDACRDEGVKSCGHDGTCDGAGSCRLYLQGTLCDLGTCAEPTFAARACDGVGACRQEVTASCGNYRCTASGACASSCSSGADCSAPSVCKGGACGGFYAEYFDEPDFTVPKFNRIDPEIDFSWSQSSPDQAIVPGLFSVVWSGLLTPRFDETYTFHLLNDDGARLFVNGIKVIDDWLPAHPSQERSGPIALHAGTKYPIQIHYWQQEGFSVIRLSWSSPSEPKRVVPTSAVAPRALPLAQ
ncbi:MAG TPA: PA14 domain-containing protein [Polyangiaceae bacterium]|nr:PA14 domain-containing protein [Polyangiaceae bacterium]